MHVCVHKMPEPLIIAPPACNLLSLWWKAFTSRNGKSTVSHQRHGFKWLFQPKSKFDCTLQTNRCFTRQLPPKWLQIWGSSLSDDTVWPQRWATRLEALPTAALPDPALLLQASVLLLPSLLTNIAAPFSCTGSSAGYKPRVKGKAQKSSGAAQRSIILSFPLTEDRLTRNLMTQVVKQQEHTTA